MRQLACTVVLTCVLCAGLRAQTVYESFNYTTSSSLGTENTGTGFSGNWSGGTYTISSGSLASGSLTTAGNSANGSGEISRNLSSSFGAANSSVWFSALLNVSSSSSGSAYTGIYFGHGGGAQFMGMGNNGSGTSVLGVSTAGSATSGLDSGSTTSFSLGTTYLLVLNLMFDSNVNGMTGTYNFYVNPTSSSSPGTAVNGATPIAFTLTGSDLIGLYGSSATATVDEIRGGGTYASVVPGLAAIPEPGSTALLVGAVGLGSVLILRRRRRSAA